MTSKEEKSNGKITNRGDFLISSQRLDEFEDKGMIGFVPISGKGNEWEQDEKELDKELDDKESQRSTLSMCSKRDDTMKEMLEVHYQQEENKSENSLEIQLNILEKEIADMEWDTQSINA